MAQVVIFLGSCSTALDLIHTDFLRQRIEILESGARASLEQGLFLIRNMSRLEE